MPVPRASYLILLCCGSAVFANSPPSAEPATSLETSEVVVYVHQVERRAAATSFAALQQFGQSALKQADAGALSRLQHVTRLMISQGEYGPAEEWNRQLAERAGQLGNARYLAMARINTLRIRNLRDATTGTGIRLVFEDQGPGIPDVSLAMRDGWSSTGTLGLGLPGSRRLVDEFDLWTEVGGGTRVTVVIWPV